MNLVESFESSTGVWWDGGLHADFDGFPWTKEDIGDEFSGGRCREI